MFKLIIGKSRSQNFKKAIKIAQLLGGTFDGNKITLVIEDEMSAYEKLFPLFRLNVFDWKNTRAYHNGTMVNGYRFILAMDQKKRSFYAEVLEQLDDLSFSDYLRHKNEEPYLYHKRDGNTFYFQGSNNNFKLHLTGKMLFDFIDKYDIGDIVYFE